jgi:predicted aspartyl protease
MLSSPSVAGWPRVPRTVAIATLAGVFNLLGSFSAPGFSTPDFSAPLVQASEVSQQVQKTLLQEVKECLQQQGINKKDTAPSNPAEPTAAAQEITERCIFSVVMLNPNGSVRADATDRMANLMRQMGTQMPRPKGQGQAALTFTSQPGEALFRVPVSIQKQRFSFLLDTGASNSVIDHQTARKLGLQGKPASARLLSYLTVGQQPSSQAPMIYSLPTLVLGRARVSQMVGIGLSTQVPPFKSDGILGLDFLSQFDVVIRPKQKRLSLLRSSAPVSNGIPLQGRLGVMTTPTIYINGKGPYTFLLDTGAAATTLSETLSQKLGLSLKQAGEVQVMGLGGKIVARWSRLDSLVIQNNRLMNKDILVANSQIFQTLGIDGVIGQDVLSQYDQHWRFGATGPLGVPERGSLELTPIGSSSKT